MRSQTMRRLFHTLEQVADTDATVLITGESGVGKGLIARTLHARSPRSAGPLVKLNCAALPADLLESELFGHEKGAFTGAHRDKLGKFEQARGGTVMLDEVGDLPLTLQPKLLHVLQDGEFARVGGTQILRADVRIVAATNRDLQAAVRDGSFREDLYYRLNVVALRVPPLRERRDEIPGLAQTFLARFNDQYNRSVKLGPAALSAFMEYSWPGNVRELENLIKRVVVLQDEHLIEEELGGRHDGHRAPQSEMFSADEDPAAADAHWKRDWAALKRLARHAALEAQRDALYDILNRVQWNRAEAARVLNISYKTLLNKLSECGLSRSRPSSAPLKRRP